MWRWVLGYGAVLAALASILEWLQYRHLVQQLPTPTYIVAVALAFIALGVWVGWRLTPQRPAGDFERNEQAIASLGLTRRECDVLERLAKGESNKEIARAMGVSPNTVKTHVANLYDKLGVTGRGKAVDAARALSLLP
ncbi:helix-turn-helix transcriptional regulator [Altererythrobacter salegens]|uniref:Helix-turn-helix transcriptional regulator n=1 Tax=Croceibacterium salegens TaxID=1737568 RepID=A0A6I4SUE6_9SPHN|nr:LuxR C-terminal-related transcriptional regulator [Croceibacterium salegens]MXO59493.1 helix-turn-helix transcriptional regulator [Croceibacterium salegens]